MVTVAHSDVGRLFSELTPLELRTAPDRHLGVLTW